MEEFNAMQVSFNTALRIFMKSPGADAAALIEQFNHLKRMRPTGTHGTHPHIVTVAHRFDPAGLSAVSPAYRILEVMRDVVLPIERYVHSFIVHGSYATQDFISSWSDVDTMIVLTDDVFNSAETLLRVQKTFLKAGLLCYWIDPLAHHQLSFMTELDLTWYPQSFLPLSSFEQGMLLLGQPRLQFMVRDDAIERKAIVERFAGRFKRKVAANDWSRTLYDWKNDLAHIFLLPSLLLQSAGIFVHKKDSFSEAERRFSDIDMRPIREATRIMRAWDTSNFVRYLPPRLMMRLPYKVASAAVRLTREPSRAALPAQDPSVVERLTREFNDLYTYAATP